MVLHSLRMVSFRAHRETRIDLSPGVNVFFGPNGAGKTNILEAIHYVCLTKSFLASRDAYAVQIGAPFFEVEGSFSGSQRSHLRARIVFSPQEGKRVFINGAPLERLSEIAGQFPVVIAAPGDHDLTAEGPEVRRRFMDNILSQARPVYLDDLINYRRALKQRNGLLQRYRRSTMPAGLLASWDAELVQLGSRIIIGRLRFIRVFVSFLAEAYSLIEAVGERPEIQYETLAPVDFATNVEDIVPLFAEKLERVSRREREIGRTLAGPHHDELVFRLNELEVRQYASQGQHRLFGLALRLAQYFYLKQQLGEEPILMLDDLFGSLDGRRTEIVLELLTNGSVGQSIITATGDAMFVDHVPFEQSAHRLLRVDGGTVTPVPSPVVRT